MDIEQDGRRSIETLIAVIFLCETVAEDGMKECIMEKEMTGEKAY